MGTTLVVQWLGLCAPSAGWKGFPGGSVVKNRPATLGDSGLIPQSGRSPGEGNSNPPQYSCLENPMDLVNYSLGVTKSQTRLSD